MFPFFKTIESLFSAKLIRLLVLSLVLSFCVFIIYGCFVFWITGFLLDIKIPFLQVIIQAIISLVAGIGGWFMLPSLVPIIASLLQEKIINRVEHVSYPNQTREKPPQWIPDLKHDIRFIVWALFLNLLVLPFYFFGIGMILSIILNTYLLGREFFEMASGYHLGKKKAKELGQQHHFKMYLGGFVITCLTFIPVINLFVPILAIVWMVHIYHTILSKN